MSENKNNNTNVLQQVKDSLPYYVTVDPGSTGTRAGSGRSAGNISSKISISSEFGEYFETNKKIVPHSKKLKDNLLVRIKSNTVPSGSYLFGNLIKQEDCVRRALNGDSKCRSSVTHTNVLVSTALTLLEFDAVSDIYNVDLLVALRPNDLDNPEDVDYFKGKLLGEHTVEFPLLERTLNINFMEINTVSEPTAALLKVLTTDEGRTLKKALLLDGGGTSIDSVMSNGTVVMTSKASSSESGGELIKSKFSSIVGQHIGFTPTEEQLEEALKDAKISGSQELDLSELNTLFHKQVFASADKELNKCLQRNGESLQSINGVVAIGKLFTPVEGRVTAYSLLKDKIDNVKGLKLINLTDQYCIVEGASIYQKHVLRK